MGSLPMALERSISELLDPEIDWRQSLFLSVTAALGKNALNWGIPHRRSDALGIHMPLEEELGYDVSVAVDTSGSVSKENLRRACSEIAGIIQSAGGQGRFLVGDASVNCDIPLAEFDATLLEGGGGTDFDPVFRHLEDHPTRLLVYFTDTWGNFPATEPSFPVVWAVYASAISAGAKVPFGEIVQIPDE
jgi:predicted metal-dependent peptidase